MTRKISQDLHNRQQRFISGRRQLCSPSPQLISCPPARLRTLVVLVNSELCRNHDSPPPSSFPTLSPIKRCRGGKLVAQRTFLRFIPIEVRFLQRRLHRKHRRGEIMFGGWAKMVSRALGAGQTSSRFATEQRPLKVIAFVQHCQPAGTDAVQKKGRPRWIVFSATWSWPPHREYQMEQLPRCCLEMNRAFSELKFDH